ncbi:polysaccharide deacetylase family protein [Streptomyces caniferus]|uniref:polysaccharide deacetylase family protein n=1 Tax=Streptomyces caniferus TaxID=285557 RepID=UPI002E2E6BB7|nr:polysaccharide deacetylase family protein [Streptomyces caniferus]
MSVDPAPRRAVAPVPAARRARHGRGAPPWVLTYHSVTEVTRVTGPTRATRATRATEDPYRITVSPDRLDRQLRWLRERGLRGVGVGELLRARAAGRDAGLVGLTFDDGYADFLTGALPLLRRHDCTATVFVLPGRPGGDNAWDPLGPRKPLLTEAGIRAVADAGMEVGSHGLLHRDLTTADETALERESAASRRLLAELTGRAPEGFCYPYGAVDVRAVAAVRAAGYGYACALDPGPLTGRHALPRVHIGAADTCWRLHLKRALHPLRRRALPLEETTPAATPGGIR